MGKSRGLNDIKIKSIKANNYLLNLRTDNYDMSKIVKVFNLMSRTNEMNI